MQITLFSVPNDSGRRGDRMGAGPLHLLNSGLAGRLEEEGHQVTVRSIDLPPDFRATEIASAFELSAALAGGVAEAAKIGSFPLVLSGNCGPAALGCVGLRSRIKIFWFDAHGDFNTPETTRSGFLDGMALAAVTGRCWSGLARAIPGFKSVAEGHVTAIGVRDVHVDLDVLDPVEGRMNGFAVPDGLSLDDLKWCFAEIASARLFEPRLSPRSIQPLM